MPTTKQYLPSRTADLIDWADAFGGNLMADPAAYGMLEAAVEDYLVVLNKAKAGIALAGNPATSTRPIIAQKTEDVESLRAASRALVRQIQARPQTTTAQRETLNITVPDRKPTPHPAPGEMPDVQIAFAVRHTIALRIRREDGGRGRPAGTTGANVYYAVGPAVPSTAGGWTHACQATRMGCQIELPASTPAGATVWVAANWYNGRGETGPLSDAVSTNLPGGQAWLAA